MRAFRKDFIREITKNKGRFLSVFFIVLLGAAFFSGIRSAEGDMKVSADRYYDEVNYMDLKVLGTLGLTDDDLADIAKTDGVKAVYGGKTVEVLHDIGESEQVVKLIALTDGVNEPRIVEGRMPEKEDEILVDTQFLTSSGCGIGDRVTFTSGTADPLSDSLNEDTFTIVGSATLPYYMELNRGTGSIGNGSINSFALLLPETFASELYTEIYIQADGAKEEASYSDAYDETVKAVRTKIEALEEEACDRRYTAVKTEGQEKIDDAKQQIADAEQKLADAKTELDDGTQQLADAKATISDKEQELFDAKATIADQEKELASGKETLNQKETELASGKATLEEKAAELSAGKKEVEEQLAQLTETKTELNQKQAELDAAKEQLAAEEANVTAAKEQLAAAREELESKKAETAEARAQYEAQKAAYEEQKNQYGITDPETEAQLAATEAQISSAENQLAAADAQLTEKEQECAAGEARIASAKEELENGEAQITAALAQIADGEAQAKAYQKQLEDGETQLAAAKAQIDEGEAQIEANRAKLKEGESQLAAARAQIAEGEQQIASYQETIQSGEAQLAEGKKTIADGESQLADAKQTIADGEKQLADAKQTIADGESQLSQAKQEISEKEKELEDGRAEYEKAKADAEPEIADAKQEIADGEKTLADLKKPVWYVWGRDKVTSTENFGQDASRISNIGQFFPVIFFLVAALVSLTTMTRMIEEQRQQIGTLKALGYSDGIIAFRYFAYAMLSTVSGALAGVVVGEKILPWVIMNAYGMLYIGLPYYMTPLNWEQGGLAILASAACTGVATLAACYKELSAGPAELMRPEAPKNGKRIFLERIGVLWKHLNFTQKATVRNLVRYKKRFFMTVIGIGGCMGLILVGFGLQDSITAIAKNQFVSLFTYQANAVLNADVDETEKETLQTDLRNYSGIDQMLEMYCQNVELQTEKKTVDAILEVPKELTHFDEFFAFRDRVSGKTYDFPTDGGAAISEKTATMLGVEAGDTIRLKKGDDMVDVKISIVVENYVRHYLYLAPELYQELFGETPDYNQLLMKYQDTSSAYETALGEKIMTYDSVAAISFTSDLIEQIDNMLRSLDIVIVVLIVSAGLLAFVVLYNLNNINITERQRELATLKVLGFYDGEVASYVYRENMVLTLFGIVAGMGIGTFLHQYVIRTVEVDMMMFGRNVFPRSYLWSALITLAFALFVNVMMFYRLRKIDMIESLKSVE